MTRNSLIAMMLLVLAVTSLAGCSATESPADASEGSTVAPKVETTTETSAAARNTTTTAEVNPEVSDPAVATAYAFLDAYNAGDVDDVLGYFAEGGSYATVTLPPDTPFAVTGYEDVAEIMAYTVASGTKLLSPQCMRDPSAGLTVVVDCTFLLDQALRHEAGYVPLPGGIVMTVHADGTFSDFEWLTVLRRGGAVSEFMSWLYSAHPEDVSVAGQLEWNSVQEAVASGEIQTRYVDEWAATLEGPAQ